MAPAARADGRDYDIVVWGATGFTGGLVCEHLSQHAPAGLKWAVGGRRAGELQAVCGALKSSPRPPTGVVVGDALDAASCARVAASARVVVTTVGPYAVFGVALAAACAAGGTHYLDLSGEVVPFVRDSVLANDDAARASGARIVHCCGYDSIPSDLLTLMAVEGLAKAGDSAVRCVIGMDALETVGGMSGGTLASVANIMAHLQRHPRALLAFLDPRALCAGPLSWRRAMLAGDAPLLPAYDGLLGQWRCAFFMAAANTRIVRRSRALLGDVVEDFEYVEVMATGRGPAGLALAVGATTGLAVGGFLFAALPPVRWAAKWLLPPGAGPSEAARRGSRWKFDCAARGAGGHVARGRVVAEGQDPGYASTAVMISEAALCLLDNDNGKGGVLTPAVACGTRLIPRLARFGIHFEMHVSPPPPPTHWRALCGDAACAAAAAALLKAAVGAAPPRLAAAAAAAAARLWAASAAFGAPAVAAAAAAAVAASLLAGPTGAPPGPLLNAANAIVHWPCITPLVDGCVWLGVTAAYVALAPAVVAASACASLRAAFSPADGDGDCGAKAVVVTGCDSGFGRDLALVLAQRGYKVFAGCLDADGLAGLDENVCALAMDVTRDDAVSAAVADVERWVDAAPGRRLLAVVNNAGMGTGGLIDWLSMKDWERDFAVNVFGAVRVSKAFLPLLRRGAAQHAHRQPPRIVVVGSMSSKLPVPYLGSYAASKHAVAAFAAVLRMELRPWGVGVCTVLPSFHTTPLLANGVLGMQRVWDAAGDETRALYGEACLNSSRKVVRDLMTDFAWRPRRVVEALERAATSRAAPPAEVCVGTDAKTVLQILARLPAAAYERIIAWGTLGKVLRPIAGADF